MSARRIADTRVTKHSLGTVLGLTLLVGVSGADPSHSGDQHHPVGTVLGITLLMGVLCSKPGHICDEDDLLPQMWKFRRTGLNSFPGVTLLVGVSAADPSHPRGQHHPLGQPPPQPSRGARIVSPGHSDPGL